MDVLWNQSDAVRLSMKNGLWKVSMNSTGKILALKQMSSTKKRNYELFYAIVWIYFRILNIKMHNGTSTLPFWRTLIFFFRFCSEWLIIIAFFFSNPTSNLKYIFELSIKSFRLMMSFDVECNVKFSIV